jgi:glycosyltransferase involved in cell wall biosynthesis
MTSLAVVMATYNGARWLPEQLDSILAQTRLPDRLIVSDDGSSDGSLELLERFAESAPIPVTLLTGPGSGLADNFWHAVSHASEDLIAWADQDDVWHADKLLRCQQALERHGCDFVSHSARTVDERLQPLGGRYPDYRRELCRRTLEGDPRQVPSGFASMFRRELLERVDWPGRPTSHQTRRQMNHDHVVSLLAFARGTRCELPEVLASYRQHGGNAAGDPTPRGTRAISVAMGVGAEEFGRLGEIMLEQGAYAARTADRPDEVLAYFDSFAARCRRRAAVYEEGAPPMIRVRRLAGAAARGDYRPRTRAAFGPLALARDAVDVFLPTRLAALATLSPPSPK